MALLNALTGTTPAVSPEHGRSPNQPLINVSVNEQTPNKQPLILGLYFLDFF